MTQPPSGTVTFLFTDIQGSTKLAREHPGTWDAAQARHHAILREAIECQRGYVFQIIGDAFCAAFHTAGDALQAAVQAQMELNSEDWGDTPIKVRMGIHTGKAEIQENGEYRGYLAMSRVQRLMSAGHGGQVLISAASQELLLEDLPEDISLRDLGERRLKDLIHPEHIYQFVVPGLPVDFPPLKTLDLYRHNLPVQLTSFIGREKEMKEIEQSILAHRLVTLTGVGGTGKTRLALQVAADLLDQFPDGIWFVTLAPITDPNLILQTILSTLGISERPGLTQLQQLVDYLQKKRVLLVLDNCEHLTEAAEKLTEMLLDHAMDLKILVTSREALGILGEAIWHVPSLSVPDPKQLPSIEQLSQYEAVQLFIERATLVQPHFQVTRENAPAIAQICFRLDGIPLAIELAAARVRTMGIDQIQKRLDDRFRLLTGGSRTALERHQTLRAAIDWSYNLLSEAEKHLLCRLSVFMGGWDLEAAEQVCAGKEDSRDIFDGLAHLVDKSLVLMEESAIDNLYRLLETTRQYAREKLLDLEEIKELRSRHLSYFLALAEKAEQEIHGPTHMKWMERLRSDEDNFRSALDWCVSVENTKSALRLLCAWDRTGKLHFGEMCSWFDRIRAMPGVGDYPALHARLINEMAHDHLLRLNTEQAKSLMEEAWKIWLMLGVDGESGLAKTCATRGLYELHNDNIQAGRSFLEQSLALYQKHGNRREVAWAIYRLGHADLSAGKYVEAEGKYLKCQSILKEIGDEYGARIAFNDLGTAAQCQGDYERAAWFYEECVKADREFNHSASLPASLLNSAWAILHLGDYRQAKERFKEGLELCKEEDDNNVMIWCLAGFASMLEFTGRREEAARLFGAYECLMKASGYRFDPADREEIDYYLVPVREHLDEAPFSDAWARGQEMTLEQAIAFALKETSDF